MLSLINVFFMFLAALVTTSSNFGKGSDKSVVDSKSQSNSQKKKLSPHLPLTISPVLFMVKIYTVVLPPLQSYKNEIKNNLWQTPCVLNYINEIMQASVLLICLLQLMDPCLTIHLWRKQLNCAQHEQHVPPACLLIRTVVFHIECWTLGN